MQTAKERQENLLLWADSIGQSDLPKEIKIIRLWAIAQMDYKGIAGERALYYLHEIMDSDQCAALFFITGFMSCGSPKQEKLLMLITNQ